MRQKSVHLMPPMSNFYARICVKATPSSNIYNWAGTGARFFLPFFFFINSAKETPSFIS